MRKSKSAKIKRKTSDNTFDAMLEQLKIANLTDDRIASEIEALRPALIAANPNDNGINKFLEELTASTIAMAETLRLQVALLNPRSKSILTQPPPLPSVTHPHYNDSADKNQDHSKTNESNNQSSAEHLLPTKTDRADDKILTPPSSSSKGILGDLSLSNVLSNISTYTSEMVNIMKEQIRIASRGLLQDEENRREAKNSAKLKNKKSVNDKLPGLPQTEDEGGSFLSKMLSGNFLKSFTGLGGALGQFLPKQIIGNLTATFAPLLSFFGTFLKFGKILIKFAGPIGIIVSIITGLIGAIRGGIEGYKQDGIIGAIKGAVIGAVDMLIGSIIKGMASAVDWILTAIGLGKTGDAIVSYIDTLFDSIGNMFSGLVDLVVGLFTLNPEKFVAGFKQITDSLLTLLESAWSFISTAFADIGPKLITAIGMLYDGVVAFFKTDFEGLLITGVAKLIEFGAGVIDQFMEQFGPAIGKAVTHIMTLINNAINSSIGWISNLLGNEDPNDKDIKTEDLEATAKRAGYDSIKQYKEAGYKWLGSKEDRAKAAGHDSWDQYKKSRWEYKEPEVKSIPSGSGEVLANAARNTIVAPMIINNLGGNVTNSNTSQVNNSSSQYEPILTGSAMGFTLH